MISASLIMYGQGKQINQLSIEATQAEAGDYLVIDKEISPGVYDTQKLDASKVGRDSVFNNFTVKDTLFLGADTVTTISGGGVVPGASRRPSGRH